MGFKYFFQDPASVYAYSLVYVHNQVMWYIIIILAVVYWSFYRIIREYSWYSYNKQMGLLSTINNNKYILYIKYYILMINIIIVNIIINLLNNINTYTNIKSITNLYNINEIKEIAWEIIEIQYYYSNNAIKPTIAYLTNNESNDFLNVQNFRDNILLEYIWAIFPSLVIFLILIPSLYLLYSMEENMNPRFNIKVIGHQWFWSYEFDSYDFSFDFESNLIPENDLNTGSKRLLEVDNRLYLPVNIPLRILITSADVLHSWAVPELGIKVDAVPGRLNDCITLIRRPGVFYGQCSELCGVGHGYMPIVIEACSYQKWLNHLNKY